MQKVIGGEFEIDLAKIGTKYSLNNSHVFSSGRAALYHILKLLSTCNKFKKVLLPDYLCESIIQAVRRSKFEIEFYNVNSDLSIDFESLQKRCCDSSIVLLINYFGCIDISKQIKMVRAIKSSSCIIADNVQGYYAMPESNEADFSFTSLRKTFPVPDGAIVETSVNGLEILTRENTFVASKIAGGILKHYAKKNIIDDYLYLDFLNKGEQGINENYDARVSDFSKLIFGNLDFDEISNRRKDNATFVLECLKQMTIQPIISNIENYTPLFIPIRIKNRDEIRKKMFSRNIFCPIHWPEPEGLNLFRSNELAKTELSLIVDQRYNKEDMKRMLDIIDKFQ